jgi:prepilin-type N-terminal cleavage/methylation domain-containing protein
VKKHNNPLTRHRNCRGYSIVELLISLAIISILSAFAAPSLITSYRNYQMDDWAGQVAGMVKYTRFEAIRRNNTMNCVVIVVNNQVAVFSDDNSNGAIDASEKRVLLSGTATLVNSAAVPGSGALPAAVNVAALTTVNPATGVITFDGRGAKTTAGVNVYWVGSANYGYRAVVVMPSGSIEVWSSATGVWLQL